MATSHDSSTTKNDQPSYERSLKHTVTLTLFLQTRLLQSNSLQGTLLHSQCATDVHLIVFFTAGPIYSNHFQPMPNKSLTRILTLFTQFAYYKAWFCTIPPRDNTQPGPISQLVIEKKTYFHQAFCGAMQQDQSPSPYYATSFGLQNLSMPHFPQVQMELIKENVNTAYYGHKTSSSALSHVVFHHYSFMWVFLFSCITDALIKSQSSVIIIFFQ